MMGRGEDSGPSIDRQSGRAAASFAAEGCSEVLRKSQGASRERTAAELLRSEALFRLVEENVKEVIWTMDLSLRFTYLSPSELEMTGFTVEEALELSAKDVLTPASMARASELLARELADELFGAPSSSRSVVVEFEQYRKDGSVFPTEATITFLRDETGQPIGLLGVSRDITERKRAEEERIRSLAERQHLQKLESLGVLAGGIAHEFNNILTGLLVNVDLAISDLPDDSPALEPLRDVQVAGQRAATLTAQMLAYAGRGSFSVEPLDVSSLLERSESALRRVVSPQVSLCFELAPELPAVLADATQLREVIVNLVTNASDAIGDTAGHVTIRSYVTECDGSSPTDACARTPLRAGRYVAVEVADTGCGMDEPTRARIFEPFFSTKFAGRGLGLAAVQGTLRGHDGAVLVDSAPGTGTTFKVLLPACEARARTGNDRPGPAGDLQGRGSILVVDDEPLLRRAATRMLKRLGFAVLTASDGVEAVDLFRERHQEVACVLLDVQMPRMGGAEALAELRKIEPAVPVLLTSGYSEQQCATDLAARGVAGFIEKPYEPRDLCDAIRRVLGSRP